MLPTSGQITPKLPIYGRRHCTYVKYDAAICVELHDVMLKWCSKKITQLWPRSWHHVKIQSSDPQSLKLVAIAVAMGLSRKLYSRFCSIFAGKFMWVLRCRLQKFITIRQIGQLWENFLISMALELEFFDSVFARSLSDPERSSVCNFSKICQETAEEIPNKQTNKQTNGQKTQIIVWYSELCNTKQCPNILDCHVRVTKILENCS